MFNLKLEDGSYIACADDSAPTTTNQEWARRFCSQRDVDAYLDMNHYGRTKFSQFDASKRTAKLAIVPAPPRRW